MYRSINACAEFSVRVGSDVFAGAGASRLAPQFLQKRAPGATGLPQLGHVRSSGLPQFSQNLASAEFSNEQFGHGIIDMRSSSVNNYR
jgi:hypothetical protein